ncbi:hypothetical protein PI125_g14657 [Phytophthora idaei]|nr:hypothetical protein PI125_g14657 [Phytophthora idaei]
MGEGTVDKQTALGVAVLAWNYACLGSNHSAGFSSCGIFSLSCVNMHGKAENVERNGLPASHREAAWQQVSDIVRQECLILPVQAPKNTKKKRKETGGHILTRELLQNDEKSGNRAKKGEKRARRRRMCS